MITRSIFPLLILLFTCCSVQISFAQETAKKKIKKPSIFSSFPQEDILELHLQTNFKQLIKEKAQKEKIASILNYKDAEGKAISQNVKIKARGTIRNESCYYPPIKLYFPKGELENAGFRKKFNDYKLVLKCKNVGNQEELVLKEYLVYKMYQLLTDNSFRVQLVHLTIEDLSKQQKTMQSFAFLIENEDELKTRIKGKKVEIESEALTPADFLPAQYDLMAMFQFMIGHTDWNVTGKNNLKVTQVAGDNLPSAIPFDFDFAGIVNSEYAVPHEDLPIKNVTERYFLGKCREKGAYKTTVQQFKSKKKAMLNLVADFKYLSAASKEEMRTYLEGFFEVIESSKMFKQQILENCDKQLKIK